MATTHRFGPFELDAGERLLHREGAALALQELPLRLLVALVEHAPELVSREELREALWPPGTHVDAEAGLNTAVARLREALGDDATRPRYVATTPRRGYRFVAPVERIGAASSSLGPGGSSGHRWLWATGTTLVVGLAVLLSFRLLPRHDPSTLASTAVDRAAAPAREHLLIGRHHLERRSREGLEKAIASFQSAIALDPSGPEAYSGLAAAYTLLGIYDFWRPREAFAPAETMAQRALDLDPASAEAHLAMGLVAAVAHWDWPRATAEMERATELGPRSPEVLTWRAALLAALGRHDEAVRSGEDALALDPASPLLNTTLAWRLFQARRYDEAIAQSHRAVELDPGYYDAWDNLKWIHLTLGNETEAVEAWVRAEEIDRHDGAGVLRGYAAGGVERLHRATIEGQLKRWGEGDYQPPYDLVLEYVALGELEAAMTWLERSFAERETDLVDLAVDPRVDPLRSLQRFREILAAVGVGGDPPPER